MEENEQERDWRDIQCEHILNEIEELWEMYNGAEDREEMEKIIDLIVENEERISELNQ